MKELLSPAGLASQVLFRKVDDHGNHNGRGEILLSSSFITTHSGASFVRCKAHVVNFCPGGPYESLDLILNLCNVKR